MFQYKSAKQEFAQSAFEYWHYFEPDPQGETAEEFST